MPSLFGILVLLLGFVLSGIAEPPLFPLATDLSEISLVGGDGKSHRLTDLIRSKAVVLVFAHDPAPQSACALTAALDSIQLQENLPRFLVYSHGPASASPCPEAKSVTSFHGASPAIAAISATSGHTVAVVDDSFHVRWTQNIPPGSTTWTTTEAGINAWLQGRQSFEANCGHCHGMDGAQASSPDVKSLVGITRKFPEAEVLRLGAQFGGVDMTGWNDAKRETLLTYIRGL